MYHIYWKYEHFIVKNNKVERGNFFPQDSIFSVIAYIEISQLMVGKINKVSLDMIYISQPYTLLLI